MLKLRPDTPLVTITMSDIVQIQLFLLLFNSDLLKLYKLTLGITEQNDSNWNDLKTESNKSPFNHLCSDGQKSSLRVCSMPSSPEDFGNTRNCDRVLVFKFNSNDIKIFVASHYVNLPNASISYEIKGKLGIPLYKEEISKSLYVFYKGSLVFFDKSLPFTAEWDGDRFVGKSFYSNIHFAIHCTPNLMSSFYTVDHCLYCFSFCTKSETVQGSKKSVIDYKDLLNHNLEFYQFHRSTSQKKYHVHNSRAHRSVRFAPPKPLSCVLHLVADHLFYQYIGDSSVIKTVNMMLSLINDADALFRSADFNGDQHGDNIGFVVGKFTVFQAENNLDYKLDQPYRTSEEYLSMFSEYDFSAYCLGVGFTYREFQGTVGTAYPAFSDYLTPGGLCQKRVKVDNVYLSYNTLVITFLNDGKRLKQNQVMLTLTHELGHSFGAQHDSGPKCESGEFGRFIMSDRTSLGNDPNNRKFSPCSIKSMLPVIKKKGNCLLNSIQTPYCGNGVPEKEEECDCGFAKDCYVVDPCCTPADVKQGPDKPCSLRRSEGKWCSPKISSCCNASCTYMPLSAKHICNKLESCSQVSFCNGKSVHCPAGVPKPNGTLCSSGLKVCSQGKCSIDVCMYHSLIKCDCTNKTEQCQLCCKDGMQGICKPITDYDILYNNETIFQENGAPCFNFGFCDSSHNCLSPATLTKKPEAKAFLGFYNLYEFEHYLKNNWISYALTILVFFLILVILSFSYNTDDTNYLKALRYGKMLAIFAMGEYQSKVYRKILVDIDEHYSFAVYRTLNDCDTRDYVEALARLKILFPEVSIDYLSRIVKISASERIAIKLLLMQGFRLRTFSRSKS